MQIQTNRNGHDAVVVIGAGIVGVCTAWHLLRRGANVLLIDRDEPGLGCSYGNAGAVSFGSVAPLAMLLDPAAPLRIPLRYLPKAAPWLWRFVRAARPDEVNRIARSLSTLLANSMEQHIEMLREIGASEIMSRTGQLYLYPDEKWLRKDTLSWTLRRDHGLRVEQLGRGDILALEPEVGPDYTIGLSTPDQGMSINPYRQVTRLPPTLPGAADASFVIASWPSRSKPIERKRYEARMRRTPPIMSSFARAPGPRNCSPTWATSSHSRASAVITSPSLRRGSESRGRSLRPTDKYFSLRWRAD